MKKKHYLDNIDVSILGFGAWPLGNTAHGKTMTFEEGVSLVIDAVNKGINFFDTAPNYSNGKSEMILGEALQGIRDSVVINTKFGHHPDGTIDFSETAILPSIEGSLKRLKTHYIDSVILHNPGFDVLLGKTRHFEILQSLKTKKIIKGFGVSIDSKSELEAVLTHQNVDVIELLFNVFSQSTRALLCKVKENNIALIIKVPLDSGWLTGKYTKDSTFSDIRSRWSTTDLARRHDLVQSLKTIVNDDNLTPYAMNFLWSYNSITTVIPGIRTTAQLNQHIGSTTFDFDCNLKEKFEHFYDTKIAKEPLPW